MKNFKKERETLRLSQSALARLSGVSRIRICLHEMGDYSLTNEELHRIRVAIRSDAARLRRMVTALVEG